MFGLNRLLNKDNERVFTCKFELYLINNEEFTDYDLGNALSNTVLDNGYDLFDDVNENISEIANKLYESNKGQFKLILEVDLTYTTTYDYFDGYDEELCYEYRVIEKQETTYFD